LQVRRTFSSSASMTQSPSEQGRLIVTGARPAATARLLAIAVDYDTSRDPTFAAVIGSTAND
jgi:hypothetical protein